MDGKTIGLIAAIIGLLAAILALITGIIEFPRTTTTTTTTTNTVVVTATPDPSIVEDTVTNPPEPLVTDIPIPIVEPENGMLRPYDDFSAGIFDENLWQRENSNCDFSIVGNALEVSNVVSSSTTQCGMFFPNSYAATADKMTGRQATFTVRSGQVGRINAGLWVAKYSDEWDEWASFCSMDVN